MRKLLLAVALAAGFADAAQAQSSPGLTKDQIPSAADWNGYFAGKQNYPLPNTGTAGTYGDSTHVPQITTDAQGRITSITPILITGGGGGTPGGSSGQIQWNSAGSFAGFTASGDLTINTSTGVVTFATVNSNVGSFGDSTHTAQVMLNAKGQATAGASVSITPAVGSITGVGTGVATALAIAHDTTGGICTVGGTGCPAGGGTLTVTDGSNSVTSATTATFGNGFLVGGTTPNATVNSTLSDITKPTSYSAAHANMGGCLNLAGSTGTLTLPAVVLTPGSEIFAPGQSLCVIVTASGNWTLTNSTGLTMTGLNSTTLPPGFSGTFVANANGTGIDFAAGVQFPTTSALGGLLSSTCGSHNFSTGVSISGVISCAQPAATDLSATGTPSSSTYLRGDNNWATPAGGSSTPGPSGGRLSLVNNVAVQNVDVAAATAIYYVPMPGKSDYVNIAGTMTKFGTLAVTLDTSNALSGKCYDVYVGSDSGTVRAGYGPDWTAGAAGPKVCVGATGTITGPCGAGAARGTGAASTELEYANDDCTNKNTVTARYDSTHTFSCAADACHYAGTFYATANGQTQIVMTPSAAAGGTNNCICVWSADNRVPVKSMNTDSTATWTNIAALGPYEPLDVNVSGGLHNRTSVLDGLGQSSVTAFISETLHDPASQGAAIGIVQDATSGTPAVAPYIQSSGTGYAPISTEVMFKPAIGFHYYQALQTCDTTATCVFVGSPQEALETTSDY